jgi:hypothetical protein
MKFEISTLVPSITHTASFAGVSETQSLEPTSVLMRLAKMVTEIGVVGATVGHTIVFVP